MSKRKYGPAPELGVWQGVKPSRKGGRATAQVRCHGRLFFLGSFATVLQAARAVDDCLCAYRGRRPNWEVSGVHAELDPAAPAPAQRSRVLSTALRVCGELSADAPRVRDPLRTRKLLTRPYIGVKCAGFCVKAGDQPIWTACYARAVFGRYGTPEEAAALYDIVYERITGDAGPNGKSSEAVAQLKRTLVLPDTAQRLLHRAAAGLPLKHDQAAHVLAVEPGEKRKRRR